MDQKTWLWRKRSSEKTIVAIEEEVKSVPVEKEVELENSLKILNEKLACVLDECSAKDELVQNYEKIAENAIADKNILEEESRRLKQELDEAHKQRLAANERLVNLNTALKDYMEQLNLVREEQEQKVRSAVIDSQKELEEKLTSLTVESSYLSKALNVKEKIIEDLNKSKCQIEAEFEALMSRLDSVEKENAFLRYEYRTLEKEFDLKHEEMGYVHKQHSENIKKLKKLESECQRLRSSTRHRLTGPSPVNANKKLGFLVDQVRDLEKENEILRECLGKKEEEMEMFYRERVEKFDLVVSNFAPDEVSCSRSSENECKMIGASDLSLMDDFVEMEKLAIVAIDTPSRGANVNNSGSKEIVLVGSEKTRDWLENVRNSILEQRDISKRSVDELLGDIRVALESVINPEASKSNIPISGYITWKSQFNVRDEFEKHLGGAGPGTAFKLESVQKLMFEMERICSVSQVEIEGLRNELEISRESKGTSDDQIENLKMMNEDLETQLNVTKCKLNEVMKKLSSVEVELDDKSRCCEELEGTCVDLQLQLKSIARNQYSEDTEEKEELLRTGSEITRASVKLSECEETILKLGNHLKALGTAKELSVVDKVLSITDTNNIKKFNQQRLSLHDQMLTEDTKEIVCQNSTPKASFRVKNEVKNEKSGALVVVMNKRRNGGIGFLRKLLIRRKKTSSKNALLW